MTLVGDDDEETSATLFCRWPERKYVVGGGWARFVNKYDLRGMDWVTVSSEPGNRLRVVVERGRGALTLRQRIAERKRTAAGKTRWVACARLRASVFVCWRAVVSGKGTTGGARVPCMATAEVAPENSAHVVPSGTRALIRRVDTEGHVGLSQTLGWQ